MHQRIGGVRYLYILNVVFPIVFDLLALFLGSTLLTLGSSCSVPLFWCYETASWVLVILYGVISYLLRRKADVRFLMRVTMLVGTWDLKFWKQTLWK